MHLHQPFLCIGLTVKAFGLARWTCSKDGTVYNSFLSLNRFDVHTEGLLSSSHLRITATSNRTRRPTLRNGISRLNTKFRICFCVQPSHSASCCTFKSRCP